MGFARLPANLPTPTMVCLADARICGVYRRCELPRLRGTWPIPSLERELASDRDWAHSAKHLQHDELRREKNKKATYECR
jgi:hypothetical protein